MERDWSTYWRSTDSPIEAMHAHFSGHVYHRHSHETYSFGVTDAGAQAFTCRGTSHVSAAGMVMIFNPDDPHDGSAESPSGFTYRMIHIGPELVTGVLGEIGGRPAGLPLFTEPVLDDDVLARRLRALHRALTGGAAPLRRDELLAGAVGAITRRAGAASLDASGPIRGERFAASERATAAVARELIRDRYLSPITGADLVEATGRSRFSAHRAFRSAYGMTPGECQRQLRLREARRLIAAGRPISDAATEAGFTDQSHLNRWFVRHYAITPGAYQRATFPAAGRVQAPVESHPRPVLSQSPRKYRAGCDRS